MNNEQKVAHTYAMIAAAEIEAMGMHAENQHRANCGNAIAYGYDAFFSLIEKYGISQDQLKMVENVENAVDEVAVDKENSLYTNEEAQHIVMQFRRWLQDGATITAVDKKTILEPNRETGSLFGGIRVVTPSTNWSEKNQYIPLSKMLFGRIDHE